MLPSFRLIVATFLCSFLAAIGGLRLVASSHIAQETLLPANAPPLQLTGAGAVPAWRRADVDTPVVFDLRFAVGATPIAPVPASLTLHAIDRATDRAERFAMQPAPEPTAVPPSMAAPGTAGDGLTPPMTQDAAEAPAAASSPAETPSTASTIAAPVGGRIEVAALPAPSADPLATPLPPGPSAALTEPMDRGPPPKVENAGTTKPATSRARRAKQKTVRTTRTRAIARPAPATTSPSPLSSNWPPQ